MDGKRDGDDPGDGVGQVDQGQTKRRDAAAAKRRAEQSRYLAGRLNDILAKGAEGSLDELERAAKIVGTAAKSGRCLRDLEAQDSPVGGEDEPLDIVGERRLRDELNRRLDDVATRLEQTGVRRCSECGRFEIDRGGLGQLGRAGAKSAPD